MTDDPGTKAENDRLSREADRKTEDRRRSRENETHAAGQAAMDMVVAAVIIGSL